MLTQRDTKDISDEEDGSLALPVAGDVAVAAAELLDLARGGALGEGANLETARRERHGGSLWLKACEVGDAGRWR